MNVAAIGRPLKVRPRIWIGFAILIGYAVVVFVVQSLSGVPYTALSDSGADLFWGAGLSLIVGTVLLAITASLLGWWRPALFDRRRSVRWPIIAPLIMTVALIVNLAATDWASYDAAFFAASVVLILVGFTEEMATRGLLLTALRSRLGEVWVWLITSASFAALHLMNVFTGQALGATVQQVGFAFMAGTILYILRRTTGTLIWAMILHGLWDFSTFSVSHGTPSALAGFGGGLEILAGVFAFIAVAFVIRGSRERLDFTPTFTPPTA